MEFIPLHFGDRLTIINPQGSIGVVTLWSKPDYVIARFREAGVDLDPATSPIAVFGTLYGNGLREMLRNLLYNPQIRVVLICGNDRSGSREELINFFELGLEPMESSLVSYQAPEPGIKVASARIRHTKRIIDDLVRPEQFTSPPTLRWLGDPTGDDSIILINIRVFFANFKNLESPSIEQSVERMIRPITVPPLPQVETLYYPSNPRGHQIVQEGPLNAWLELVFLITRFGRRVILKKGERMELQNVKVVVEEPEPEEHSSLLAVHLDPAKIGKYYIEFLEGNLRSDETYNYGNRLLEYFNKDTLAICAARLKRDSEDRKSYVALWNTYEDLADPAVKASSPCLVSLFFRKFESKLTLSATFRTHNAMDAWLLNLYGLMAVQERVANLAELDRGAIVVISHSISIDPKELDRALMVAAKRKWKMHLDPMGYFRITLDDGQIIVEHRFEDVTLKEYRGKTAVSLQHQIARDVALSDINHAIYLGRQLAKAEMALKDGREFVQD
jgi:thymidylate synthase